MHATVSMWRLGDELQESLLPRGLWRSHSSAVVRLGQQES